MTVLTKTDVENLNLMVFIQEEGDAAPKRVAMPHIVDVVNGTVNMWVPKVEAPNDLNTEQEVDFTPVDPEALPEPPADNLVLVAKRGKVVVVTPDRETLETKL